MSTAQRAREHLKSHHRLVPWAIAKTNVLTTFMLNDLVEDIDGHQIDPISIDIAFLLPAGTPFLMLAKVVHGLATLRLSFASRGSHGAKAEPVGWLLLGAVDSHTLALLSGLSIKGDTCARRRPELGDNAYHTGDYFFDYPVNVRCVWPNGETAAITPWHLNILTALFAAAAVAVTAYTFTSAYRRFRHNAIAENGSG